MFGDWILAARFNIDGMPTEIQQPIHIAENDNTTILPRITYVSYLGEIVDINLNQTGVSGGCSLTVPTGETHSLYSISLQGVQVQNSSHLVSCRVTIGPITQELLGEWILIEDLNDLSRQQPVTIVLANTEDSSRRQVIIAPEQSVTVQPGDTISMSVGREEGLYEGCFLTTSDGTTLPLLANTRYPGVTSDRPNIFADCVVAIGPADDTTLGRWTLATIYNVGGERIQSRQPFNIMQDDGTITLSTITHLTHEGTFIDINLNQTGATGGCVLKDPDGTEHILPTLLYGVTVHHSSKFVSCRVTIGPMEETLLGEWVLIQRIIGDRERKQPVRIQWANPLNPESVSRVVISDDDKNAVGLFGDIIPISAPHADGILDGCYLTTPDEAVLRISADRRHPGVSFRRGNSISPCNAAIGPIDNNMEGNWTMSAIFDNSRILIETRQLIVISRNTAMETVLPRIDELTNFGAHIDVNINAGGWLVVQSCSLVTPDNEIYKLDESLDLIGVTLRDSSRLVTCHVTIGPMTAQLLGQWTLIEHLANGSQRRRTVNIAWANPANPVSEPRQLVIDAQQNIVLDAEATTTVSVAREEGFYEGCFVVTPDGYVLPISEITSYPGLAWSLPPTSMSACSVTFGPVDKAMMGRWILAARFNNGGVRIQKQQPINLVLADGTTTLPLLEYLTSSDAYVDINMNRTDDAGFCYLKHPTGAVYDLDSDTDLPGVTVHDSDLFVSCRVTIGPMSDYLLGEWSLIEEQPNEKRTIQPVSISWINPSNPHEERSVTKIDEENIQPGLGSILCTSIGRQDGMFEGCFLTTPAGVILPVFPNTQYPAVKFLGANSKTSCRLQIGPVHSEMAGKWILSAKYNNHGVRTELQKTINFRIRDNSSIFITPMPRQIHLTNIGANVDISLSNKGVHRNCRLTTPAKQEYLLDEGISLSGVTVQRRNKFVACRVTIGPMTEDLLGEWIIIEEDSPNTARKQIVRISWANPWDPTTEATQLVISTQQSNVMKLGETVTVSVRREDGFEEGCSVITPDGAVLPVSESFSYPGITWHFPPTSVSACSVVFGPMDVDMVGRWNLAARFNKGGTRVETRQPFDLILEDTTLTLPVLEYSTHFNAYVDINVNQTGVPVNCSLINPNGHTEVTWNDLDIDQSPGHLIRPSDHFVSCRANIGPISESLLGKWTLIEKYADGTERHQPVFISWNNPSDPYEKRQEFIGTEIVLHKAIGSVTSVSVGRLDGVLEGCFLLTDRGSLLPVFPYTRYPDIMFIGANNITSCIIQIGPISADMDGRYTLIARYNNFGTRTEIRNEINLFIRNVLRTHPFPRQVHLTNIGATIDISLKRSEATGNCRLLTPTGREYIIDVPVALSGVTVQSSNRFVSCRVTIGPMTEELLGNWVLGQDGEEIQYQQPARLLWANPWNPSAEVRQILYATEQNSVVQVGNSVTVIIRHEEGFEEGCFLITPDGAVLPISESFNHPGFAWYSRPTGVSACNVTFGPMDNDMVGRWTLGARFNNGGRRLETRQPIRLTLKDGATTLPTLEYLIHRGAVVDINLNHTGTSGTCILRDTSGQEFTLTASTNIPGVTVHSSNKFVSCRLSIGPIDNTLLGEWTLIHQQTDGTRRLQPVIVSWINPTDPLEIREVKTGSEQHVHTSIGNIVSTSIERQNGLFEGCFMTTPDGTVLPVFHNTRYPGVVFMGTNSVIACTVQLGPVHNEMEGKWILAARFNYYGARYEVQNTINIIVEETPSLNVTTYPRQEYLTHIGANVEISLSQSGVNGNCRLRTPIGEEYILGGLVSLPGVTVHSSSSFVSCRVAIGPITEELLGNWMLSQQDSVNTLRQQPATISWANPLNPSVERQLIIMAQQNSVVDSGEILNVSIRREDGFSEGCFVTTPNGEVLPLTENIEYPGITWATSLSVCTVGLGPMETNMLGRWIVADRFHNAGVRVESQQPINLVLGDGTTSMPVIEHFTHVGDNVDLVLNQTQIGGQCYLKTPKGEEYNLTTAAAISGITVHSDNNFVSCRVTIGPMTESLLGQWTLIQRHTDGSQRLQPITITWANWQDPYGSREIIISEEQTATVEPQGTVTLYGERHEAGQFEGCFISPPDGGVLPIFASHRYPGITHAGARITAPCIVELRPVDKHMVGEWILASRFNVNGERVERRLSVYVYINGGISQNSLTILIVVLCVVCPLVLAVGGVMVFKRSRQWTMQRIHGLRSSFRSTGSRNEMVNVNNPLQRQTTASLTVEQPTKSKA